MNLIQHFVNGKIIPGKSDRKGKIFNPATGEQESEVKLGTKLDLDEAVNIAKKAFDTWSLKPPIQRARIMFKFKELIEKNSDELTKMIVSEHGKVYEDAKGSLTRGLEVVEFACGIPQVLKGEFTENVGTDIDSWSIRQPLGVCAGITPFNFPAMVPMWMFPMAIACGNTFVLKPSEKDPSCSLRLAELLKEAGLPDGVFNVVNGDKEVVDAILINKDIKAVSFVGSTPIAKYIYSESSRNGKRCQALGGAKNHLVVMPDAETSEVVNALTGSAFGSAGERCMAISVAVCVGEKTGDRIVESLKTASESLRIGSGLSTENEPDLGPLITGDHKRKVKSYIESGVEQGAKLVIGQHGGHFGSGLIEQSEVHQIQICDRFFTWGWKDPKFSQVRPLSPPKLASTIKKGIIPKENGSILWVWGAELPKFFYRMHSVPLSSQWLQLQFFSLRKFLLQFKAFAINRAVVVFPTPRIPVSK